MLMLAAAVAAASHLLTKQNKHSLSLLTNSESCPAKHSFSTFKVPYKVFGLLFFANFSGRW